MIPREEWPVFNVPPEGFVRTPFGGHFALLGVKVVRVEGVSGTRRGTYIPDWTDRVFRVFPASGTARDDAIRALLAADEEARAAALTVLDLGGLRPFADHVLGRPL